MAFAKPSFQSGWPNCMFVDFYSMETIAQRKNSIVDSGPANVESCPSGLNKGKTDQEAERMTSKSGWGRGTAPPRTEYE